MKLLMKKLIDVLRKFKCHFGRLFLFVGRPCNYVHHMATNKKDFCLVVVYIICTYNNNNYYCMYSIGLKFQVWENCRCV